MRAAWKAEKIKHFESEAEKTEPEPDDDDDPSPWRKIDTKPTCNEPCGDLHLEWVYIIDLDSDSFIIRSGSGCRREFKLQNLPCSVFEQYSERAQPFMMPVALKHLHTAPAQGYNSGDLARFTAFAPRRVAVDVPQESHFKAGDVLDPWKPLSQFLLEQFLERYITFFKELNTSEKYAIFVSTGLDSKSYQVYQFKQLAYGILNLCDAAGRVKFRKTGFFHQPHRTAYPPTWDPPDKNILWISDVLVILETRITIEEFLHAAIGKAIDLISRSRVRTDGIHGKAVIFSIQALVIVDIRYSEDNTNGPVITYSDTLRVITPSECKWYRCFGGMRAEPTPGLAALIDIFAGQSESYSLPACLPVEICTQIYNLCDLTTRKSMTESCRAFRALVKAYPQIDSWDLLHTWNHGNVGFVARRGLGLAKSVVSLEPCKYGDTGFQMGFFRGGQTIELDLPRLKVVKQQQQEGYKGCACCVGLPIITEAPGIMGRTITFPPEMDGLDGLVNL